MEASTRRRMRHWGMFTRRGDERVQAVVINIAQHPEVRKARARAKELVKLLTPLEEELHEINDRLDSTVCEHLRALAKEEGFEEARDSEVREWASGYVVDGRWPEHTADEAAANLENLDRE